MNQEEIAFKLIEAGAELMAKNKRQYTALHLAISNAMFDVAVRLIESGASLNAKEWVRFAVSSFLCYLYWTNFSLLLL
jgi:ankyrin repeat protein